jgi:hypothetical protein
MPILQSNFATDGSVDTTETLFAGKSEITTPLLTAELADDETEAFFVDSAEGTQKQGFAVIDDEVIFYSSRYGKYEVRYLQRGYNGTTPAVHSVGATVTFTPIYYIPSAIINAIIELQTRVIGVEGRVETLEGA